MFRDYAIKQGWAYREGGWYSKIIKGTSKISLKQDIEDYDDYLPYMDTLRNIKLDDYITNGGDLFYRANDVSGTHSRTGKYKWS